MSVIPPKPLNFTEPYLRAPLPMDHMKRQKTIYYYQTNNLIGKQLEKVINLAKHIFKSQYIMINIVETEFVYPLQSLDDYSMSTLDKRESSYCGHTILDTRKPLIVPDSLDDWRFLGNPHTVGGIQVRFYAAFPIRVNAPRQNYDAEDTQEFAVGAMCIFDTIPRTLTDDEVDQLDYLSQVVNDILDDNLNKAQIVEHQRMSDALAKFIQESSNNDHFILEMGVKYLKVAMHLDEHVYIYSQGHAFGSTIHIEGHDVLLDVPIWESADYSASAITLKFALNEVDHYLIVVFTNDPIHVFDIYDANFVLHFSKAISSALQEAIVRTANRAKTLFIESVSHEMRTPLHGVMTSIELMQEEERLSLNQIGLMNIIQSSTKNLLTVINGLLDFNKWEGKDIPLSVESFNVFDLQQEVADAHIINLSPECEMILEVDEDTWFQNIRSDSSLLRHILMNFMSNSVKFTQTGDIVFKMTLAEDILTFSLTDSGMGMSKEFIDDGLFIPFKKADAFSQGIGLGMAIANRLAKTLDATLTVESELGKGTTLRLSLRVEVERPEPRPEPRMPCKWQSKIMGSETRFISSIDAMMGPSMGPVLYIVDYESASDEVIEARIKATKDMVLLFCRPASVALIPDGILGAGNLTICTKPVGFTRLNISLHELQDKVTRPHRHASKLKILIVDDNAINRNMLAMYCKKRKLDYTLAVDGFDAFEKFKASEYDIIFMDIQMPNCDGPNAVKLIRDFEREHRINNMCVIIMLTGISDEINKELSFNMGCNEYCTKPVSLRILDKLIEKHV